MHQPGGLPSNFKQFHLNLATSHLHLFLPSSASKQQGTQSSLQSTQCKQSKSTYDFSLCHAHCQNHVQLFYGGDIQASIPTYIDVMDFDCIHQSPSILPSNMSVFKTSNMLYWSKILSMHYNYKSLTSCKHFLTIPRLIYKKCLLMTTA